MMPMPQLHAITLLSLLHFAGALLWCGLVLLSTAGYGAALLRLARLPRPGLTLSATAGFGVVLALGGVLNLAHRITVPALLSTVAAGLVAGLLAIFWRRPGTTVIHPRPARGTLTLPGKLLLATFALVFVLRLGASVHTPYYQPSDDYNFYLAAPVKMLETHIFGPDPFSERRVMSSVGGNHFLEVLVLAELPLEDLQMADRALGLMLSALLAFALAREFRLPPNDSAAWALFVLATPQLQFNLTFVILPAALFFGMVYVAVAELGFPAALGFPAELGHTAHLSHRPWLRGILLGLLAGAVTSLKSTYIVPSITFLLCFAVLVLWRSAGRTATAKLLLAAAMAAAAVLLPWSIVNHTAAGTWFYPTLGLGFHYTRWGGFAPPGNHSATVLLFKVLPFSLPPLAVFLLGWFRGRPDLRARTAMSLTLAAALSTILVGIATGGDSVRRYNYPALLPGMLLLFPVLCRPRSQWRPEHPLDLPPDPPRRPAPRGRLLAASLACAIALYVGFNSFTWEYPWGAPLPAHQPHRLPHPALQGPGPGGGRPHPPPIPGARGGHSRHRRGHARNPHRQLSARLPPTSDLSCRCSRCRQPALRLACPTVRRRPRPLPARPQCPVPCLLLRRRRL